MIRRDAIKRSLLILAGCIVCLLLVQFVLVEWVPAPAITKNRLRRIKKGVELYVAKNHSLPKNMMVLSIDDDRSDKLLDGWGWPIVFETDGKQAVTLRSLGRDNAIGGIGDDADIEMAFEIEAR